MSSCRLRFQAGLANSRVNVQLSCLSLSVWGNEWIIVWGTIMAAMVLNSPRATEVSVYVVRAFVHLREFLASHRDLARRLEAHERKLATHDQAIAGLVDTIRMLMAPSESKRRPIGFVRPEEKKRS